MNKLIRNETAKICGLRAAGAWVIVLQQGRSRTVYCTAATRSEADKRVELNNGRDELTILEPMGGSQ